MSDFLSIQGLSKSYQSGQTALQVLVDLNLEVERGQMVAVTGASGSGKSTFLHLVGGMDKPDAGSIFLEGENIVALEGRELARFRNQKVGFIFQFHHLLPEFTALENVMFPLLLRRMPEREASGRARRLLEEVGLSQREDHQPGELSGGEQQRVAVARALAGEPTLLLGDEPTGNLDDQTSKSIYRLLLDVHAKHNLTSIIVTHDSSLAALCQVQKRLYEGQLRDAEFHL